MVYVLPALLNWADVNARALPWIYSLPDSWRDPLSLNLSLPRSLDQFARVPALHNLVYGTGQPTAIEIMNDVELYQMRYRRMLGNLFTKVTEHDRALEPISLDPSVKTTFPTESLVSVFSQCSDDDEVDVATLKAHDPFYINALNDPCAIFADSWSNTKFVPRGYPIVFQKRCH